MKYMQQRPDSFKEADVGYCLERLRKFTSLYRSLDEYLIALIRSIDLKNKGLVEWEEFALGVRNMSCFLTY